MLQRTAFAATLDPPVERTSADEDARGFDLDKGLAAARRQWRQAALVILLFLALGGLYLLTAVPLYTASTSLLIDRGNSRIVDNLTAAGGFLDDDASILSQVELLRSEGIGLAVVDELGLGDHALFMSSGGSPAGQALAFLRAAANVGHWFASGAVTADTAEDRRRAALKRLLDTVEVSRLGRSYVLRLSYTSADPALSAAIARAFAEAYLTDQLDSKYEATRRASEWLQARIDELREQSLRSDLAVQQFRTENNLIAADGRLISDQQLSELNSQLLLARAGTAEAEARYDRIRSIIESGDTTAVVSEALQSTVINDLRARYLDASKRQAEIAGQLGADHVQALRLRNEMAEYERLIFEELGRIAESYQSELEVARTREASITDSVSIATSVSAGANETLVQLRELEREAESYRTLYQTFLQRYQEAVQQQSFPITEARVITQAEPPSAPSHPRTSLVLAVSLLLGLAAGAGLGAFREYRDRFFRTADQVRDELGLACLGLVPLIPTAKGAGAPDGHGHPRALRRADALSAHVVDHPLSSFTEALRSAKLAADLTIGGKRTKILGIVSVLPGEGKSTISSNLAELIASGGARTLLIDADLRNPGLTRGIARHAETGLVEVLTERTRLADAILSNPATGLAFLPAVARQPVPHTAELLASPAMNVLLTEASTAFDFIVLDLPPLGPVIDVRAIASAVDGFVFVAEWGRTARRLVRSALRGAPEVRERCLGVLLNKTDAGRMTLYGGKGSLDSYAASYGGDG